MSLFGLHPIYSYLILIIISVILFFLLPKIVIHPILRKNLPEDQYLEDDECYLVLTCEQNQAFEYIKFNQDINNPKVTFCLKGDVDMVDLTIVYDVSINKEVKHYTLALNKDKNRVFTVSLKKGATLHSVLMNKINKTKMPNKSLYFLNEGSVTLLTILQCVNLVGSVILSCLCIDELILYNELDGCHLICIDLFNGTITDSVGIIILLIIIIILIFPLLNSMNKSLYKKELFGGWLND